MSNYKGHLAGGSVAFAFALLFVARRYQPTFMAMAEWLAFALAGSLFPDIDIKSKGQKYFYWFIFFVLIYLTIRKRYDVIIIVSLISVIPMLVKHRGLFHRAWFVIAMPLVLWHFVTTQFPGLRTMLLLDMIFFIVGALSHLWLDMGFRRMLRL